MLQALKLCCVHVINLGKENLSKMFNFLASYLQTTGFWLKHTRTKTICTLGLIKSKLNITFNLSAAAAAGKVVCKEAKKPFSIVDIKKSHVFIVVTGLIFVCHDTSGSFGRISRNKTYKSIVPTNPSICVCLCVFAFVLLCACLLKTRVTHIVCMCLCV